MSRAHLRLRIQDGHDPAAGVHPAGAGGPGPEVVLLVENRGVSGPDHGVEHPSRKARHERSDRDPDQDRRPGKRVKRRRSELNESHIKRTLENRRTNISCKMLLIFAVKY